MSKTLKGADYKYSQDSNASLNSKGSGNGILSKLASIDAFGQPVNEFNYQGSSTYKSCYGGVLTVISVGLVTLMLGVKISSGQSTHSIFKLDESSDQVRRLLQDEADAEPTEAEATEEEPAETTGDSSEDWDAKITDVNSTLAG
jgi:hypothetical protein